MEFRKLIKTSDVLIEGMKDRGYSPGAIRLTERALKYLLDNAENDWITLEDAFHDYVGSNVSKWKRIQAKTVFNRIAQFIKDDSIPNGKPHINIERRDAFSKLNAEFKTTVERYGKSLSSRMLAPRTITVQTGNASSLLYKFQKRGYKSIVDFDENAFNEVFCNEGKPFTSVMRDTMRNLIDSIAEIDDESRARLKSFIPPTHLRRKAKQYLTKEEQEAIRNVINNDSSELCLRDRAIGALLFYTALRSIDISGLCLRDIDWDMDRISITQDKTDEPITIPLRAVVGNPIYDYVHTERPDVRDPHVFLTARPPYRQLSRTTISRDVVNKIFSCAGIRGAKDDQKAATSSDITLQP